jgi:hypothetical protein
MIKLLQKSMILLGSTDRVSYDVLVVGGLRSKGRRKETKMF